MTTATNERTVTVLPQRFREKVYLPPCEDDCWLWIGGRKGGNTAYGQFYVSPTQRHAYAHRVAYEALVGRIPRGLRLDHLCENPPCINPSHLEPVTNSENLRRGFISRFGVAHHNLRKTRCPQGHEYTPENTYLNNGRRTCKTCALARARRQQGGSP